MKTPNSPYIYKVPHVLYDDLFTAPPYGHFGVIPLFPDLMIPELGEEIHFQSSQGDLLVRGIVVAIEGPKSCIRTDLKGKDADKWKLHWVPLDFNIPQTYSSDCGRKQPVLLRKKSVRSKSKTRLRKATGRSRRAS